MLESKQAPIKDLLKKSLLGEELVNTQFHLFSSRSKASGNVLRPRTLCANNALLVQSAEYFKKLLTTGTVSAIGKQSFVVDIGPNDEILQSSEYDYESDSDLDDEDEIALAENIEQQKELNEKRCCSCPVHSSTSLEQPQVPVNEFDKACDEDDIYLLPDARSSSTHGDMGQLDGESKAGIPIPSSAVTKNAVTTRSQSTGVRHVLVKDTAFRTWYSLLLYLYTGEVSFKPLKSSDPRPQPKESPAGTSDEPRCSAKSMYRLACKIKLDKLREEALKSIREKLSAENILPELVSEFTARHPEVLEMELNFLFERVNAAPVLADLSTMMRCIANGELPHGASIMIGLHQRMLDRYYLGARLENPNGGVVTRHEVIARKWDSLGKKKNKTLTAVSESNDKDVWSHARWTKKGKSGGTTTASVLS